MARKYEFRPDKTDSGLLNKLYMTPKQRLTYLKWLLYALMILVLSVIQDVVLCKVSFFGVTTDLVPMGIMLVCLLEGVERGCIFAILAACFYLFSGAPGYYCLPFVTITAVGITMFRQSYLRSGFSTTMVCLAIAMLVYELAMLAAGFIQGLAGLDRLPGFCLTAALTLIAAPILYPMAVSIGKIGGEIWKE